MAHMKRKTTLTDNQKRLVKLLADNYKLHATQRVSQGSLYNKAGYNNKNPDQGVASEIRKPHIKIALTRLCPTFYGATSDDNGPQTAAEEAMDNLKKFSKQSSQGAYNYTEALRKQAAEGGGVDIVPVLLSAFLTESELDEYRDKPQDVVVATDNKPPEPKANAETPVNIKETCKDE